MTKELLSAILNIEVSEIAHTKDNLIYYYTEDIETKKKFSPMIPNVSVYELAFKAKEWAYHLNHNFILVSTPRTNSSFATCSTGTQIIPLYSSRNESEVEAIFEVCQYLLERSTK